MNALLGACEKVFDAALIRDRTPAGEFRRISPKEQRQ
jgi:hypothetical protein